MSCSAVVETPPAVDDDDQSPGYTEPGAVHIDLRAAGLGKREREWKG